MVLLSWGEDERGAEVGCTNQYGVLHVLGGVSPVRCVCHVCVVCVVWPVLCVSVFVACFASAWCVCVSACVVHPDDDDVPSRGDGVAVREALDDVTLSPICGCRYGRSGGRAARRAGGWAPRAPAARAM
jgi:hypothetical protein